MSSFKIFIVEDDPFYGELLKRHLALNPDNEVLLFKSGREVLANLHKKPQMISLDYRLPDMTGMEILKKIHAGSPEIPVIIVSGQEEINTAVELIRVGAYDYFVKDDHTKTRLWNAANKIRENVNLKKELQQLKNEVGRKYEFTNILKGSSKEMHRT